MGKELIIGGVIVVLVLFVVVGCGGYKSLLKQLPAVEFDEFSYHRAGNVTSADIVARGCRLDGNSLVVDEVTLKADYGPAINFNITLKGYKRTFDPQTGEEVTLFVK